jgi:prophage regulatory protein
MEFMQRFLEKFLKLEEVLDMVGMGQTWVYEEIKEKRFPDSIPLGSARRWVLSEVQEWMQKQVEAKKLRGDEK